MNDHLMYFPDQRPLVLAPGDEVARYVGGKPIYCTVVEVVDEDQVVIEAEMWPAGYTALVQNHDVSLVSHKVQ
jgi:hypothetical protein